MTDHSDHIQTLIVGYGPAGAMAAALLGARGHKTLVIDRDTAIYDKPRAIALDHEILRHFDNLGLLEAVLPHTAPFTASEHFGAEGQLIRRIDMVGAPYPMGYVPNMVFSQPPVELALRQHVESLGSVTVALGTTLEHLDIREDHAIAHIRDADGLRHIRADWVLGCDGASSAVRRLAGITLEDLIFDEPWLVVDLMCNDAGLARLPATSAQFCNPARPVSYVIGPGAHRRFEIMLKPDEDPAQMSKPEQVWSLLSPWIAPDQGWLWRATPYRFHALVAQSWRRGPVYLAGDAAHQQPPFLGQGMCQGLRDVANLTWRLDQVLTGQSPAALLDSYQTERKAHVTELTSRIKEIGAAICIQDPVAAAERDRQILAQGGGQPLRITRQEIVPPLRHGLLSVTDCPGRGMLFPQPKLRIGAAAALMDKVLPPGWRLVLRGGFAPGIRSLPHLRISAPDNPAPDALTEDAPVVLDWFDRLGVKAAILRPDHYVYATAATLPALHAHLADLAAHPAHPAGSAITTGELV
jgi:3-(3-hydroxy-phenyl)propionate hydroxylase